MTSLLPCKKKENNVAQNLSNFLWRNNLLLAKWEDLFDSGNASGWWHVIKDEQEDYDSLGKKVRYSIRKGKNRYEARPVSKKTIEKQGYPVFRSAFSRYSNAKNPFNHQEFITAIRLLPPETEFWLVRDRTTGEMVGFSENFVSANICRFVTMWHNPIALKENSGYVLIHEMNKHYLNERKLEFITNGVRNIYHDTAIHEFLESKFGYRKAYCRLMLVYHPIAKAIVSLLFPIRNALPNRRGGFSEKTSAILELERIRRSFIGSEKF